MLFIALTPTIRPCSSTFAFALQLEFLQSLIFALSSADSLFLQNLKAKSNWYYFLVQFSMCTLLLNQVNSTLGLLYTEILKRNQEEVLL